MEDRPPGVLPMSKRVFHPACSGGEIRVYRASRAFVSIVQTRMELIRIAFHKKQLVTSTFYKRYILSTHLHIVDAGGYGAAGRAGVAGDCGRKAASVVRRVLSKEPVQNLRAGVSVTRLLPQGGKPSGQSPCYKGTTKSPDSSQIPINQPYVQMGAEPAMAPLRRCGYLSRNQAASIPPYDPPNPTTGVDGP